MFEETITAAGWSLRAALASAALLLGCGDDEETQCNLALPAIDALEDGSVEYTASVSGEATIQSVTYQGEDGEVTVDDPPLPFSVEVSVSSGDPIALVVKGKAEEGGNVSAGYVFVDTGGADPLQMTASCR